VEHVEGTRVDVDLDVEQYIRIVHDCFPQVAIHGAEPITQGWDSFVLDVETPDGELIFRFPLRPDVERMLAKEVRLLPELAQALPTPIPQFAYVWSGEARVARPFVGYRKLSGVSLDASQPQSDARDRLERDLALFLTALHRFPTARAAALGVSGGSADRWREEYRTLHTQIRDQAFPLLSASARARATTLWESYLEDDANLDFTPALIHRDLGAEHILWERETGQLSGVIDWGDAAVGDPALDFVGLFRCCGRDFTEHVLATYRGALSGARDDTLWPRIAFYARIVPFYEVLFGLLEHAADHLRQGIAAIERQSDAVRGE
jgi:aminoglycoside 2''-phosphotransferase